MKKTIINVVSILGLVVLLLIAKTRLFLTYWKFYVSVLVLSVVFSISDRLKSL